MFWRRRLDFNDEASKLVQHAQILATSSYMPLSETFPALDTIVGPNLGKYDFLVTVAAVCSSFISLKSRSSDEISRISVAVGAQMDAWDKRASSASDHLVDFIKKYEVDNPDASLSECVGLWIYLNLRGRLNGITDEEFMAFRGLGQLVVQSFQDWWDKN